MQLKRTFEPTPKSPAAPSSKAFMGLAQSDSNSYQSIGCGMGWTEGSRDRTLLPNNNSRKPPHPSASNLDEVHTWRRELTRLIASVPGQRRPPHT